MAATTRRRARHDYGELGRLRPSTSASAYLAYGLHAALIAVAAWRKPRPLPIGARAAGATGLILASAGASLYAAAQMTLAPPETSGTRMGELATGGAYRVSRNPQLVGWGLVLLGAAIAGRSAAALGLWAVFAASLPGTIRDE
ncbi:MAG: hypothetical protein KAG89_22340 [Fulvimarina manganoxydans]|uniref:methyltransferase n=1 Tax=Fulvimarina manganoxydans TaxID=937218 RepID=UPI0023562B93|nr:methyltransferase [Fulvimarina manganoxydans]MCK5934883.1 hypothetical protein [Fulvimarina manganoxydans]